MAKAEIYKALSVVFGQPHMQRLVPQLSLGDLATDLAAELGKDSVSFTKDEVGEIYNLIDELSGSNPENGFAWDGTDDPKHPTTSALVKIFKSVGASIPESCE